MQKKKGFLLLKPKTPSDSKKVANAIAMCKGVKEVFLTSGQYGFVATVEADASGGIKGIASLVRKATRCISTSFAVAHYVYRKGEWR
ncbi:MAG: hypothetical protein KGH65_02715 [Candidatus Micrarchaeota archaeon]|nr:hypothetical protein [Candidatus Micrarchaeota archaeon]